MPQKRIEVLKRENVSLKVMIDQLLEKERALALRLEKLKKLKKNTL